MSETWLDFAIRRDAPVSKQGYSGAPQRTLEDIEGEVKHSTEGPLLAAFGELDKLERRASWTFTIDADGTVYQHFPLESITWHCGVLGDRSADTSLIGNLTLVGEEHVDRIGGVQLAELTAAATISSIRVSLAIRRLCPKVAAHPATLRLNEWEHGWLSWTACPSGLIPWDEIIPALNESPQQEESDMKLIVLTTSRSWPCTATRPGQALRSRTHRPTPRRTSVQGADQPSPTRSRERRRQRDNHGQQQQDYRSALPAHL
jgi:hypothetical protein